MVAATLENLKVCKKCGESASGPDLKSVKAAMARHNKKRHPAKRKSRAKAKK